MQLRLDMMQQQQEQWCYPLLKQTTRSSTSSAYELNPSAAVAPLQVLTWLVLPFFQVYADAGDFTVGGRCMTSLKENGLLYGLAGAAGDWRGAGRS